MGRQQDNGKIYSNMEENEYQIMIQELLFTYKLKYDMKVTQVETVYINIKVEPEVDQDATELIIIKDKTK